jgi:hypothetical protein
MCEGWEPINGTSQYLRQFARTLKVNTRNAICDIKTTILTKGTVNIPSKRKHPLLNKLLQQSSGSEITPCPILLRDV